MGVYLREGLMALAQGKTSILAGQLKTWTNCQNLRSPLSQWTPALTTQIANCLSALAMARKPASLNANRAILTLSYPSASPASLTLTFQSASRVPSIPTYQSASPALSILPFLSANQRVKIIPS